MGQRRGLALNTEKLQPRRHLHDFIGGEKIAAREVVGEAGIVTRLVAVGLEPGGFLADHLAQPFGRFKIIDPEDLLHPGIGDEGASTFAVEIAELAHILQDGPELEAIARHQAHGALYSFQTT